MAITSTPKIDADEDGTAETYGAGETVEVTVTWDADVLWDVSAAGAAIKLDLDIGGEVKRIAMAAAGTGGTARALAFRYAVQRGDIDADGVFPKPAGNDMVLLTRGATVTSADGARDARRAHAALPPDPAHKVDGGPLRPAIEAVAITSIPRIDADEDGTAETYGTGETIEVTVTWDGDVLWDLSATGAAIKLDLDVGGEGRRVAMEADGTSGTARSLEFRYVVHRRDADTDGVFPKPAGNDMVLLTRGATLKSTDGELDAHRAHAALAPDPAHKVDGTQTAPTAVVDGATLTLAWSSPRDGFGTPAGSDYAVRVNGTPRAVDSAYVAGRAAVLALAAPVAADDAVTVGYVGFAMHPLADAAGRRSAPWDGVTVRNLTGASGSGDVVPVPVPWAADQLATATAAAVRVDASGLGLEDAAAVGWLSAVERLDLSDNALTDIGPLAALGALRELDLSGNRIAEVGPLRALYALERLDLSDNRVADIAPLAGLPQLRVLLLDGNRVTDVGALTHAGRLENLGLAGNAVVDVAALQDLPRLRRLDLDGNPVTDLSPLGDVGSLVWLALPGEPAPAADTLGRLTGLRWIWAGSVHALATNREATD